MVQDPSTTSSGSTFGSTSGATAYPAGANGAPATHHDPQDMLQSMTQGAHQTIDRLAEQVAPQLQRLQQNMADASGMLDERADQIRETADAWMATLRSTVREHPLAAVGTALALGLLVARLTR